MNVTNKELEFFHDITGNNINTEGRKMIFKKYELDDKTACAIVQKINKALHRGEIVKSNHAELIPLEV